MAKLKASLMLELPPENLARYSILFLVGEDFLMKEILAETFARATNLYPHEVEVFDIDDARNICSEWEEGSLMGARFLKIRVAKLKNPELFEQLRTEPDSLDKMVVYLPSSTSKALEKALGSHTVVECKEPKTVKEKEKLIIARAKIKSLELLESAITAIAERSETLGDIESNLTTLQLVQRSQGKILMEDVLAVSGEATNSKDLTKAILRGNTVRLNREMIEGVPIANLSTGIQILLRLYVWLCNKDKSKDSDLQEKLKIKGYGVKDWEQARSRYSPQLIREVLRDWRRLYQKIRIGKDGLWQEELRLSIAKLNKR